MMISMATLPASYSPLSELTVCTNRITDGGYLLAVGTALPLLVGVGSPPRVWLQASTNQAATEFATIVDSSFSRHPSVKVESKGNRLIVSVSSSTVLDVSSSGVGSAMITKIDLRPMGFNVYGDDSGLVAGGVTFKASTFAGGGVVIGFANAPSQAPTH